MWSPRPDYTSFAICPEASPLRGSHGFGYTAFTVCRGASPLRDSHGPGYVSLAYTSRLAPTPPPLGSIVPVQDGYFVADLVLTPLGRSPSPSLGDIVPVQDGHFVVD
uniref:Uncharacterized protein n=1 Tax=Oryza punctata TaxID=4537 RepID=A0A0E0KBH4_ORYPU